MWGKDRVKALLERVRAPLVDDDDINVPDPMDLPPILRYGATPPRRYSPRRAARYSAKVRWHYINKLSRWVERLNAMARGTDNREA